MDAVILYRNKGKVGFIEDEQGNPSVFTEEDAMDFARDSKFLHAVEYRIVMLDNESWR